MVVLWDDQMANLKIKGIRANKILSDEIKIYIYIYIYILLGLSVITKYLPIPANILANSLLWIYVLGKSA